jgi:tetratricopeptide (TPR) repeat protein
VYRAAYTCACVTLAAGLLAIGGPITGQPAVEKKTSEPSIDELIAGLAHPAFAVRERAQRELWKRGAAAVPALEKAARDEDPEVAKRARDLLDKFGWGILPDTPGEVVSLIRKFQGATPEDRKAALTQLLRKGPPGVAAVRAILLRDLPPETRKALVEHLTAQLRREVPLLLYDKKLDDAAALLALHTLDGTAEGVADYAAFQALRGTLPAAIAEAEAAVKAGRHPTAAKLVLAHLYRAHGDWAKARDAVAEFPRQPNGSSLVEMLLEEEGNWAGLADAGVPLPANLPDALDLTLQRLAGRKPAFDESLKRVLNSVSDVTDRELVREAAYSLLLNHRAAEATELLTEKRQNLGLLAEMLIGQLRYKEALDLQPAKAGGSSLVEKTEFDVRRARVLATLGQREAAVQLFGQVAESFRGPPDRMSNSEQREREIRTLLRTELRVGLKDLAGEHAAAFLTADVERLRRDTGASSESLFEVLFTTDAVAAETLFGALRDSKIPSDSAGATMKRVRDLLGGTAPKAAVDEAVKALGGDAPPRPPATVDPPLDDLPVMPAEARASQRKANRLLAAATILRMAKRYTEAEADYVAAAELAVEGPGGLRAWAFGVSDAARPWVELGEFLIDRGRLLDAAAKLEAGWKRFPDQPLLLFLSGQAMVKAGHADEGRRRIELSHWVGLGNERARGRFLDELVRRAEANTAKRETELVLRACWPRDFHFGNVMNQAARASVLAKDFATAERCVQRSLFVLMRMERVYFVDASAYFSVPHDMLVFHARALLGAGKIDEAMEQARACLKVTPGHLELISGMVPELDKLGRKKEADELFGLAWSAYTKVLAEYPESPTARGSLANLGANCRRELDKSLVYAKEAVAADPTSVPHREALAEVHFRRGERAEALAVMTKLADEQPRSRYYRRLLVRYRDGDVASPLPDTADE